MAALNNMHRVFISQVGSDAQSGNALVILEEPQSEKLIPIWIGSAEAAAISFALQEIRTERPLTHQLLFETIEKLDYAVEKVEITEIKNKAFFANLYLAKKPDEQSENFESLEYTIIDSRPSDAIAVALLSSAPIFVADSVLESAGLPKSDVRTIGPDDEKPKKRQATKRQSAEERAKDDASFKAFVDNVKASDFRLDDRT